MQILLFSMALLTRDNTPVHPLGIGTWEVGGGLHLESKTHYADYGHDGEQIASLRYSLSQGQNHIDGAYVYSAGHADEVSGEAMKAFPRESLFFASKVWRSHSLRNAVVPAVKEILRRAQTEYADLIYIHAPFAEAPMSEYLMGLKDVLEAGLTRYIGLSNFNLDQLKQAEDFLGMSPQALQNRCNLLFKRDTTELLDYCQKQDIAYVAYRPVERGEVEKNEIVRAIAEKHQATPGQIAISWLIQMGMLPIPKALRREHIDQNLRACTIRLTEEEMAQIQAIPDIA